MHGARSPLPHRVLSPRRCFARVALVLSSTVALLAAAGPAGAIDLKNDFESLQLREYYVRVGLVKDAATVSVTPEDTFYVHDQRGAVLFSGPGGTKLSFTFHDTRPAKPIYYQLLETFDPNRRDEAEGCAEQARKSLGLEVQVIEDPRQPVAPSAAGGPPPPRRWVAAVGPYTRKADARYISPLIRTEYQPEFFETVEFAAQGWVEARNAAGVVVARAQAYLGIRPERRDARIATADTNSQGASNRPKDGAEKQRRYRGLMEVWVNPSGRLSLVNRVFIEQYLYGVVPPEIGHSDHKEAKKVQAVISRTDVISKLRSRPHAGWPFDVCPQQHCQVYLGADAETEAGCAAVDATWGQVCTYRNDIIKAVYFQCCGGVTANNQDVWVGDPVPYLQGRYDAGASQLSPDLSDSRDLERWVDSSPDCFCSPRNGQTPHYANGRFRWRQTVSAAELAKRLRRAGYININRVLDIRVISRGRSGRVKTVEIVCDSRRPFRVEYDLAVRRALGNLPSTFFVLDRKYDAEKHLTQVVFKGAGSGHGVGLCQAGALRMDELGYNYVDILKHYYQGIDIYRIYR
ncbi:SpoIID/LytB domain-containing protein [Candidatus Sumerlaeota bacterium]|nr:SpoIID/LytB domain-containing protein [Candidatus Sumerlaeota bacterium]